MLKKCAFLLLLSGLLPNAHAVQTSGLTTRNYSCQIFISKDHIGDLNKTQTVTISLAQQPDLNVTLFLIYKDQIYLNGEAADMHHRLAGKDYFFEATALWTKTEKGKLSDQLELIASTYAPGAETAAQTFVGRGKANGPVPYAGVNFTTDLRQTRGGEVYGAMGSAECTLQ